MKKALSRMAAVAVIGASLVALHAVIELAPAFAACNGAARSNRTVADRLPFPENHFPDQRQQDGEVLSNETRNPRRMGG